MSVGEQYLFFLAYEESAGWQAEAGPFARMSLDPTQRLVPVAERWTRLPAILQLTCLTVDEAEPLIVVQQRLSRRRFSVGPPSTPAASPR